MGRSFDTDDSRRTLMEGVITTSSFKLQPLAPHNIDDSYALPGDSVTIRSM